MSFYQDALKLAAMGFHVFPLIPNSKLPLIEDYPHLASTDPEQIKKWWICPVLEIEQSYNIGISTTRFGKDRALLVVDVDNKEGKRGDDELLRIEMEGLDLPETFEQQTPTGGRHLIFVVQDPVKQGVDVLGRGLDIRSRGGYVVGAGSSIDSASYSISGQPIPSVAPKWLIDKCGTRSEREKPKSVYPLDDVAQAHAESRATYYLQNEAPLAIAGDKGDQTTFAVAARLKDFGVGPAGSLKLMAEFWNPRCSPPWREDELESKVENAYRYGNDPIGFASPEADFSIIPTDPNEKKQPHPFDDLNQEYAYVGGDLGYVIHETKDHKGQFLLQHIKIPVFHQNLASLVMGESDSSVTKRWIASKKRRSYQGICFSPEGEREGYYNLWRGFAVVPTGKDEKVSLDAEVGAGMFLEHVKENLCNGDEELTQWVLGYFSHIFQRPWERPDTALFIRGGRGTGKSSIFEHIREMMGFKYVAWTSDSEQIFGRFNSLIEGKILLVLDEGLWSGDKKTESKLKDLITRRDVNIERKGFEPYSVDNYSRVIVMTNDDKAAPAAEDERRYAVFKMGNGKKQDKIYFKTMGQKLKAGGYSSLLRFFLDFDLSKVDVKTIPITAELMEQKLKHLDPIEKWWYGCLNNCEIVGANYLQDWPAEVPKTDIYKAFLDSPQGHQTRYVPDTRAVGIALLRMCPSINANHKKVIEGRRLNVYRIPDLKTARAEFSLFMNQAVPWDNELDEDDIETGVEVTPHKKSNVVDLFN